MQFENLLWGSVEIDGVKYPHDIVINGGAVEKRDKHASKARQQEFGHTPLTAGENIPWNCDRILIGSGHVRALPIVPELYEEAHRRGVELMVLSTPEAFAALQGGPPPGTNAILHLTC